MFLLSVPLNPAGLFRPADSRVRFCLRSLLAPDLLLFPPFLFHSTLYQLPGTPASGKYTQNQHWQYDPSGSHHEINPVSDVHAQKDRSHHTDSYLGDHRKIPENTLSQAHALPPHFHT
jgi:hypothetical protein